MATHVISRVQIKADLASFARQEQLSARMRNLLRDPSRHVEDDSPTISPKKSLQAAKAVLFAIALEASTTLCIVAVWRIWHAGR
jgi:hypothetical protein